MWASRFRAGATFRDGGAMRVPRLGARVTQGLGARVGVWASWDRDRVPHFGAWAPCARCHISGHRSRVLRHRHHGVKTQGWDRGATWSEWDAMESGRGAVGRGGAPRGRGGMP
ncbi:hypothetical protein R1flu_019745 [Riccia fluitans]|uniref:Uncharacterized protein n=1 Tax=Riccia fluitans TaxID=41844 RepID=A0ABD1ZJI4_9MARC